MHHSSTRKAMRTKYSLGYQVIWIPVRQQKWRLFVNKVLHPRRLITMFQIYSCSLESLLDCHQPPSLSKKGLLLQQREVSHESYWLTFPSQYSPGSTLFMGLVKEWTLAARQVLKCFKGGYLKNVYLITNEGWVTRSTNYIPSPSAFFPFSVALSDRMLTRQLGVAVLY